MAAFALSATVVGSSDGSTCSSSAMNLEKAVGSAKAPGSTVASKRGATRTALVSVSSICALAATMWFSKGVPSTVRPCRKTQTTKAAVALKCAGTTTRHFFAGKGACWKSTSLGTTAAGMIGPLA